MKEHPVLHVQRWRWQWTFRESDWTHLHELSKAPHHNLPRNSDIYCLLHSYFPNWIHMQQTTVEIQRFRTHTQLLKKVWLDVVWLTPLKNWLVTWRGSWKRGWKPPTWNSVLCAMLSNSDRGKLQQSLINQFNIIICHSQLSPHSHIKGTSRNMRHKNATIWWTWRW